jgi:hypothetical protein
MPVKRNRQRIFLTLAPRTVSLLQALAAREGTSQSQVVDRAVTEYAGRHLPERSSQVGHEQLIELIKEHGVEMVGRAVTSLPMMVERGWDLTNWQTRQVAGAVLFYQVDKEGVVTSAPRILCVNAPARDRARWEQMARESDAPTTVLMTSGGRVVG